MRRLISQPDEALIPQPNSDLSIDCTQTEPNQQPTLSATSQLCRRRDELWLLLY